MLLGRKKIRLILLSLLIVATSGLNAMNFTIEALFPGKAMVKVYDKRILLKAGTEKNGLKLISTDTYEQTAVIEVEGVRDTYSLGRHVGGGYAKPSQTEVRVSSDNRGSFRMNGQINGQGVNFLLDTGATTVAMNAQVANRLRIDYLDPAKKVYVNTAGGQQDAYRVVLKEVSIGSIKLYDIPGVVLSGNSPEITLLGMSFLGQLEIEQKQNLMVLRKKF